MSKVFNGIMKFEVKTEQNKFSEDITWIFFFSGLTFLAVLLINIGIELSKVSKYYEISYRCKLIMVDKSAFQFKKLSKLTKQNSKQRIWDLCKQI